MSTWNIGSVAVTRIEEVAGTTQLAPERYLVGFERALLERHLDWLVPNHYAPAQDRLVTSVHSWLIRTPRHTVLLDCCAGNHKERPWTPRFDHLETPFLDRLAAAGVAPADVDIVLCTHLHADHVGWNTRLENGRWVPTFPNARYLFSRAENAYWDVRQNPGIAGDERRPAYLDSVLPVIESGQAVLLDADHAIDDSMQVEPAPGHTVGHVVLKLQHRGERGLFCGDVIHHALQVYAPHWNSRFCEDAAQARASRARVLQHCAEEGALLFPTHFGAPHVARIAASADAYSARFVPADV